VVTARSGTAYTAEVPLQPEQVPERPAAAPQLLPLDISVDELFEASADGLVLVDRDGNIADVNAALTRLLGYERHHLLGRAVEALVPVALRDGHRVQRMSVAVSPHGRTMGSGLELHAAHADGLLIPVDVSLGHLSGRSGPYVLAAVRDARERRERERGWVHRALHDPLTGLANRALLVDRLEQALRRLQRREGRVVVLFLDLDAFKRVNDEHGHAVGDLVLIETGNRLLTSTRPSDTVARLGGDEFVVLLEDEVAAQLDLEKYLQRLRELLAQPITTPHADLNIGCSIGAAVADTSADAEELLHLADDRMYADKAARRRVPHPQTRALSPELL
jgi:diguanylate cyclase (GGDEF)-like protein/PAS domain S-box-containing protein